MFSGAREPVIVRYLHERIRDWQQQQNCLLLLPKDARFERLLIFEDPLDMPIDLFRQRQWRWVGTVPIEDRSSEKLDEIYSGLKAYEIKLMMEGFFRNKPRFLAGTSTQGSDRLVSVLTNDRILIWLVKKIRPDSLSITPDFDKGQNKLSWLVSLVKGPIENTMLRKSYIQRMYSIIERTSNSSAEFIRYLGDEI